MIFKIQITASGLLSFLVFIGGFIYSVFYNDSNVFISSITTSSLLMGVKTVSQHWAETKNGVSEK